MLQEIVARALNVVKTNPEWIAYVKNFDDPKGFLFKQSTTLDEICTAIDDENPIHSGASIAMCLQQCKFLLNKA